MWLRHHSGLTSSLQSEATSAVAIVGCPLARPDFDHHNNEVWKSTFYILDNALRDQCPFVNLAMADLAIDVVLPAQVLLCIGLFPSNPLGVLATVCHARKLGLVELFMRDQRHHHALHHRAIEVLTAAAPIRNSL